MHLVPHSFSWPQVVDYPLELMKFLSQRRRSQALSEQLKCMLFRFMPSDNMLLTNMSTNTLQVTAL